MSDFCLACRGDALAGYLCEQCMVNPAIRVIHDQEQFKRSPHWRAIHEVWAPVAGDERANQLPTIIKCAEEAMTACMYEWFLPGETNAR